MKKLSLLAYPNRLNWCHIKNMARPLFIPNPENETIEELKQDSRVGSIETATRCTAIQMLLARGRFRVKP